MEQEKQALIKTKKRMKKKYLLILIFLLALFLRFYKLGQVPPSLKEDEVAMGYDAYSILKTGKDQYGQFLPTIFRSLDDYKPPFYEYLAVLPIAIFGLNDFAVRFPSAFFGSLTVLLTYFLVKEIFKEQKFKKWGKDIKAEDIALLSAFFLSISSWHLHFSRAAFEVTISLFMLVLAVLFFYKGFKKGKFFYLSSVIFGLGLFSYHSARVVFPLILAFLVLAFQKKLFAKYKKEMIGAGLLFALILLFYLPVMFSPEAQIRFLVTNDLQLDKVQEVSAQNLLIDQKSGSYFWGRIFHNRRIAVFNWDNLFKVLTNYFLHLTPEFLFIRAGFPMCQVPGHGLLSFWEAPFLILGLVSFLLFFLNRQTFIFLFWFLTGPLPASITWQAPHPVRTMLFLPTFQIFISLGVLVFAKFIKKEFLKPLVFIIFTVLTMLLVYNFAYYFHQYYVHLPFEHSRDWQYGREEAAKYTWAIKDSYEKVIVSPSLEQPHAFFLYYLKYDPIKYLKEGGTVSGGFREYKNKFDKYRFYLFDYEKDRKKGHYLFVGEPKDFPPGAKIIKTIYYLNGEEAIKIAES